MKSLLLALLFTLPIIGEAAVWETTQQWTPDWEKQYSDWVKTSWQVDVFRKPNSSYPGLYPDCADSVYSARIIFASLNGLPSAILNPNNRKSMITNEVSRFDGIPEGTRRVTAYLNWIYDVIDTHNMPNDTFPVAITRETVRPGGMMLAHVSKHSYTIKNLRETGVPVLYYSTQANRGNLKERSWPSVEYLFAGGIKEPSGIRDYRQPQDILKNVWDVPGYSDEQYNVPMERWTSTMQARLALRDETAEEALHRGMADTCQLLMTRLDMVDQATEKNRQLGETCMNPQEYDDLSTPSRDGQTAAAYNDLFVRYRRAIDQNSPLSPKITDQLRNIFARSLGEERGEQYCIIKYGRKSMTMGEFRRRQRAGLISSNPNDTPEVRWGDEKGPSPKAARCPIY